MPPVTVIKPAHRALQTYYDALRTYGDHYINHETALRSAFQNLLAETGKTHGWALIPEQSLKVQGKTVRPDGTLRDEFNLPRGYWEAKDTGDDLDDEIRKKAAKGYPLTNTIFEDTRHAALYQDGKECFRADLTQPQQLADLLNLFYGYAAPDIEGFEQAVTEFQERVPELAKGLDDKIKAAHKDNKKFQTAYMAFFELCKTALNPNISQAAVDEMLVQHLLTERLIRKIFDNPDFMNNNAIAVEIEKVIRALVSPSFSREEYLKSLDRFYRAIEDAAHSLDDFTEKQHFLNSIYERFFQGYSVKLADTHGIVYTPQPIVDFMCASVVEVLQTEFGKSLGDPDVVILDPATGTGNFIVNLLRRIPQRDLEQAYKERLFANEIMLLPYYIAALNIEHAYYELTGQYEAFEGLCFVDTLDIAEGAQLRMSFITEANSARVERQKAAPITVIIGNPPYNVGQINENDNNKNRTYEIIDKRIRETYAKDSQATNKNALSDAYVKFFRWAVDRLQGRDGIVCMVTNNSFIDQIAFDGMRSHLEQDFTRVYHIDLHGNVRQNPKLSGTTHNVFGIQVGVGITIAIRSQAHSERQLYYHRVPEDWRKEEKLRWLSAVVAGGRALTSPPTPYPTRGEGEKAEKGGLSAVAAEGRRLTSPPAPYPTRGEGEREWSGKFFPAGGEGEKERAGWSTSGALWEKLKPLAREKRTNPTEAEDALWQALRDKTHDQLKFRRQHPFERFIVDFYCVEARLIIEVDGPIHDDQRLADQIRQAYLESLGLRVIRFTNDQVLQHLPEVLAQITQAAAAFASSSTPSPLVGQGVGGEVNLAIPWQPLTPDHRHTWLIPENADAFATFLPIGGKESKAGKAGADAIFKIYGRGVATSRDDVVYDFDRNQLTGRVKQAIEDYNAEVDRYKRVGQSTDVDKFVNYDRIKWSESLKANLRRGRYAEFDNDKVRISLYRPFDKRYLYFDEVLNERRYQFPQILPVPAAEYENRIICFPGLGNRAAWSTLMLNCIPNLSITSVDAFQCFPFYVYDEDGSNRRENVTDWALAQFRDHYSDQAISKWDIFYYVYGVLHHPGYREKFADNLKRELPRIPFAPAFRPFAEAGRQLADLHLNYETVEPYRLRWIEAKDKPLSYRVEKMRLSKDKTQLVVNESLTLADIPAEAFAYRLGNRAALDWVIDQYQVTTDKRSGITSDPNREDAPRYIVDLVERVVKVSLETVKIVAGLPEVDPTSKG